MTAKKQRAFTTRMFVLRRGDKISATAALVVFGAFLAASIGLEFGTLASAGPGLWPTSIAVLGLVFAGLLFALGRDTPVLAEDQSGKRLLLTMAVLVLYAPTYSLVGFIPASALALLVLVRFSGGFGWVTSLLSAAIGSIGVYAIFSIGLNLPIDAF